MNTLTQFVRSFVTGFFDDELTVRSAALSYYAIFSVIPALALALSILTLVFRDSTVIDRLAATIAGFFPSANDIIGQNIARMQSGGRAFGAIGVVGLLWSASGYFSALTHAVNHIFGYGERRSYWVGRGLGVATVMLVGPLLLIFVLLSALSQTLIGLPYVPVALANLLRDISNELTTIVITGAALTLLYRFVPSQRPTFRPTLLAGVVAAATWVAVTHVFVWFLHSRFSSYHIVSSAIDALIALLLWFFLSNLIVLLGAELAAQIHKFDLRQAQVEAGRIEDGSAR